MLTRLPMRAILYPVFILATALAAILFINLSHERANIEKIIQEKDLSPERIHAVSRETRNEAVLITVIVFILGGTVLSLLLVYKQYRSARKSLGTMESLSSNVLRSITRGVIVIDLQGKISSLNKAFETIFNLKEEDLSGVSFREVWNREIGRAHV